MKELAACMLSVVVAVLPAKSTVQDKRSVSDADWAWLEQNRQKAFEALMPVRSADIVAYRSYQELYQDRVERYFRIDLQDVRDVGSERLVATIVLPITISIQQQMLDEHVNDRMAPVDDVLSRLKVQRLIVDSTRCHAIGQRLGDLARTGIRLAPADLTSVTVHPVLHRIVVNWAGGSLDATLEGSAQPLAEWARRTYDEIRECARASTPAPLPSAMQF